MARSQPPYPPEFRREAVQRVQTGGKSRNAIARDLGISTETLRQWVKQAELDAGVRHDGLTTEETEGVRRLSREIKTPREEREILKPAAFFANAQRAPAACAASGVQVRGTRGGPSCRRDAVPCAGRLHQWLLRLAGARTIGAGAGGSCGDCADSAGPSGEPADTWCAAHPCRTGSIGTVPQPRALTTTRLVPLRTTCHSLPGCVSNPPLGPRSTLTYETSR